jgi:acyl-CoA dehydrogenase
LAEAGLPWIGVGEEAGGSGGTTSEALSMAPLLGYHAAPLPVVETGLLAGWLLSQADMKVPAVPITVASDSRHDQLSVRRRAGGWVVSGVLHRVPWAQRCERVAALAQVEGELHVLALPLAGAAFKAGANLAGEPRDTVSFVDLRVSSDEVGIAPEGVHEEALRRRGALARALQMAGAASAAVDLSIEHADGRVQFGRPIAQFQAVKHLLVRAAEESALAVITSAAAVEMFESEHQFFVTAAAKVVCGRAARTVASAAHQVHGAIGMTQEYELQLRTRRLMSWSQEFGSEPYWARRLGAYLAERGPDQLWGQIATGPLESTS